MPDKVAVITGTSSGFGLLTSIELAKAGYRVVPTMRKQRSGHIIQLSSILGLHGSVTISSYAASKHALEGWSESLRLEVNALGIKVVLLEPGSFATGIWSEGTRMGRGVDKK